MKINLFLFIRKKIMVNPAIIVIVLFAFLAVGCTKSEDLAPAHYDKGVNLMQAEDYKGAIIEFKNALHLIRVYQKHIINWVCHILNSKTLSMHTDNSKWLPRLIPQMLMP